jgi:2-polyprenyl-3-methyl-5-hydroxy-6-metoxy-1,4-benzoquinol methylase
MTYDPDATRSYFDDFAEREWHRLATTVQGRVKHAVHRRILEQHVRPGMRVLDVGSGPGRFAIDIIALGARVTLVDLSQVQLDLARRHLAEAGALDGVDEFRQLDVLDLAPLEPHAYDVVVCFGGALSYTMHHHVAALRELARVAKPASTVLLSVMSLLGALRLIGPLDAAAVLEDPGAHMDWNAVLGGAGVVYTKPESKEFHHPIAMFTTSGLRDSLIEAGLEPLAMATSNPLFPEFMQLPRINASEVATRALIELEVAFSDAPGLTDAGGHLLAVARTAR